MLTHMFPNSLAFEFYTTLKLPNAAAPICMGNQLKHASIVSRRRIEEFKTRVFREIFDYLVEESFSSP